ncbi:hypothetical protein FS837_006830, partial [Tulasnella sp. UAMH 9824]
MDGEIEVMEETLESLQTSLNTRIIQRKKQRNSLIRFNQLPLEIASNILWLSIADPWVGRRSCSFLRRQQTISSVCSSWRTLVEGSPRFFSIIEFSCGPKVISQFLEKSQSRSLEIKCFTESGYDCTPRMGVAEERCFNPITPHTGRTRSLVYSGPTTDGLLSILGHPAPMLEELKLEFEYCTYVQPLELFCGQAGRLSDVALKNILVRWDSEALVGLRSLDIKGRSENLPTEKQVRRLLEANPGLERLDIEDLRVMERFGNDAVEPTGGGKPSRVIMSKIQEMRLFNLPFELVRAVLCNVEFPSIRYLKLKCLFRRQPASRLLGPNMEHLVPPLLQRSKGANLAEIAFGGSSIGMAVYLPGQESPTIQIELQETVPISGFEWLAENFFHAGGLPSVGEADIFRVSIKFGDDFDMAGGTFIPFLDRLNAVKVKDLTIESGCQHGGELIKYFGKVNGDSQWPLPYLTSMTINGPAALANDLSIALQRRKHYALAEGTPTALRPATLEILNIGGLRGVESKVEKALAKCVGAKGKFVPGTRDRHSFAFW